MGKYAQMWREFDNKAHRDPAFSIMLCGTLVMWGIVAFVLLVGIITGNI